MGGRRQEIYLLNSKWQSLGVKYFTLSNFSHWEWYRVAACDVRGSRLKTPGLTSWLYQDHLILESLILLRGGGLRGNTRRIHSCLLTFRWMIEDLLCCWRRALLIKSLTSSIWLREFCMKWFCSLFEGFKGFHFFLYFLWHQRYNRRRKAIYQFIKICPDVPAWYLTLPRQSGHTHSPRWRSSFDNLIVFQV